MQSYRAVPCRALAYRTVPSRSVLCSARIKPKRKSIIEASKQAIRSSVLLTHLAAFAGVASGAAGRDQLTISIGCARRGDADASSDPY